MACRIPAAAVDAPAFVLYALRGATRTNVRIVSLVLDHRNAPWSVHDVSVPGRAT
jgi:hypothetical protein